MIRPPSLQNKYDLIWSGDDAIRPPPTDATDEQKKEHEHALKVARETGHYVPVLLPEKVPSKFVVKPLSGEAYRWITDQLIYKAIGPFELASLAFRAALCDVVNCGDIKYETTEHPRLGKIASEDVTNRLDAINPSIVGELGGVIYERARGPSGKS